MKNYSEDWDADKAEKILHRFAFVVDFCFMNETHWGVAVSLKLGGRDGSLCLNQISRLWDDMFGFSQQLSRPFLRRRHPPGLNRGVMLTYVNGV